MVDQTYKMIDGVLHWAVLHAGGKITYEKMPNPADELNSYVADIEAQKAKFAQLQKERDEWETMFSNVAHAVNTTAGLDDSYGWDDGIKKIKERRSNSIVAHDKDGKHIAQLEARLAEVTHGREGNDKYTCDIELELVALKKQMAKSKRLLERVNAHLYGIDEATAAGMACRYIHGLTSAFFKPARASVEEIRPRATGIMKTGPLHTLWTKAVGTDDYVKQEWRDLEEMVINGQSAREKIAKLSTPVEKKWCPQCNDWISPTFISAESIHVVCGVAVTDTKGTNDGQA